MIPVALLALAAIAGGSYLLSRGEWRILNVEGRAGIPPLETRKNLWKNAIIDLLAKSPDPQSKDQELPVTVNMVALASESPDGLYTGVVTYAPGTTFREGTFLTFGPQNVYRIQA
jgi:hypothetical protein